MEVELLGGTPWARPESHALEPEEFEQQLRAKGKRYHIYHPYQVAMNSGKLTKEQIQGWVYNRFYYQITIPIKDAAITVQHARTATSGANGSSASSTTTAPQGDEGGIEAWSAPGRGRAG